MNAVTTNDVHWQTCKIIDLSVTELFGSPLYRNGASWLSFHS
jgi:hypothetical protein